MVVDETDLPQHTLGLGTLGHWPLVAGSVDTDEDGREAVETGTGQPLPASNLCLLPWSILRFVRDILGLGGIKVAKSGGREATYPRTEQRQQRMT